MRAGTTGSTLEAGLLGALGARETRGPGLVGAGKKVPHWAGSEPRP